MHTPYTGAYMVYNMLAVCGAALLAGAQLEQVQRAIDAYNTRRRDRAYFDYTQAMTIGAFIGSMFSSKSPPALEDLYPDLFDEEAEELEQIEQEKRDERSAANFIKFANAFNRNYENGDRKSESENNG